MEVEKMHWKDKMALIAYYTVVTGKQEKLYKNISLAKHGGITSGLSFPYPNRVKKEGFSVLF